MDQQLTALAALLQNPQEGEEPFVNPAPGDMKPFSSLQKHQAQVYYIYTLAGQMLINMKTNK